ncbi:hypothetical protein F5890DRAFT_1501832 [Lentinula detonsa]|uniref:Secreted protein n=1 Tax=Lentinula detonsa TaxID=2804962 RepID=A0AA38Q4M8_9AGAR|nr:hypothetical protein F5890DRAFT_1501832 [Lentinula detonsa]
MDMSAGPIPFLRYTLVFVLGLPLEQSQSVFVNSFCLSNTPYTHSLIPKVITISHPRCSVSTRILYSLFLLAEPRIYNNY